MVERTLLSIDFGNVFILIPLNISDIELKKDLNTDESENFNTSVWIYLVSEREYKEFTVIRVNFNIVKGDNEEHLYNENDFYLEFNNTGHYNII